MNGRDQIEVQVSGAVMLVVSFCSQGKYTSAGVYKGQWPGGTKLSNTICNTGDIYVADDTTGVWFNDTFVPLAWANLLKVADFLQLDIPQPAIAPARGSLVDLHA